MPVSLPRALLGEVVGTAGLLTVVVGSGIMGERLADGNLAVALLANALATVGGLFVLIELFGPVSGAHFNPLVSLVLAGRKEFPWRFVAPYVVAQFAGAAMGAVLAHIMFELPLVQAATKMRGGLGQWVAEIVATVGLILVVLRAPEGRAPALVASFIGAAYWFTSSTSFANPAAAFGRMLTDTFSGIAPASVPAFVLAEIVGAGVAVLLNRALVSVARETPARPMSTSS